MALEGSTLFTRLWRTLPRKGPWFWLLCINGGAPIAVLTLTWQMDWLFWLVGAAHILGLVIAGSQRARKHLHHLVVLALPAIFASYIAPAAWSQDQKLRGCPHAVGISVRDATGSSQACWFQFRDGVVRNDLGGEVTIASRDSKRRQIWTTYHAYPIVPEGWTPEEPVTAWSTQPAPPGPPGPLQGFWLERPRHAIDAANAAAARHGLLNHPRAAYLALSPSLSWEQYMESRKHDALLSWAVPNLLWLVAALVFWVLTVLRSQE